jgi:hypothetical protein
MVVNWYKPPLDVANAVFSLCFARPGEVGRTNMGTHKIKLLDDKPVRESPRRIPMYKRQAK